MRKLLFLAFFICPALTFSQQLSTEFDQLPNFIDSAFHKGIADGLVPGGVFGLLQKGELVHGKAYGLSNIAQGAKVDFDQTIFQLGSVGKLFTALAVLKEVERSRLDLHRNVNDYLSSFEVEAFEGEPITLHHLLTHTAGLNERVIEYATHAQVPESLGDHLRRRIPSSFTKAGQEISYSNYSFGLAGHLVELSSGMKFQDYIQAEILDVLQMGYTTYEAPGPGKAFATGYELNDEFEAVDYLSRLVVPAGSIASTGADLAKFMRAILQRDERLLSQEGFDLLMKQHFTPHPFLSGHGYGMEVQNFNGNQGMGKGGNIPGFLAYVMFFPELKTGVFAAVNTETDNFLEDFTKAFKNKFFHGNSIEMRPAVDLPDLSPYAGDYRINRYNRHTLEDIFELVSGSSTVYNVRDSALALYHNGKMNYYQPVSDLEFQNTIDPGLFLIFEKEQGRVHKMHRNVNLGGFHIPATFEKLKWYGTVEFVNEYAGLFPIFILTYLLFPLYWLVKLLRRKKKANNNGFRKATRLVALSFSGLVLLSMYSFASLLDTGEGLIFGVPKTTHFLLNLNYLLPVLLLLLLYRGIYVWVKKEGNLASRIYLILFAFAAVAYTAILHQWHLIGAHV